MCASINLPNRGHIRALFVGRWQTQRTVIDHHTMATTNVENVGTLSHDDAKPNTKHMYHHRPNHITTTSMLDSNCTNHNNCDKHPTGPEHTNTPLGPSTLYTPMDQLYNCWDCALKLLLYA